MTLGLDHIFICTQVGAPEAQALVEAGFVEGSRNVHPGQGTSNRRFFFQHGFLELLWVHDPSEATSDRTAPTRLWERWSQRGSHANPFGICFAPQSTAPASIPFSAWTYEPIYLPASKRIHFAQGTTLSEPELFVLSWPQNSAAAIPQPREHGVPLHSMRTVSVGLSDIDSMSAPMRFARDAGLIQVHHSVTPELVIEFSSANPVELHVSALGVTLRGHPAAEPITMIDS